MKQLTLSESEFKDLLDGVKHSVATDDSVKNRKQTQRAME